MTAMQKPVRLVAPAKPIVSVPEARQQCSEDSHERDELLFDLCVAASDHLDGYSGVLGRALLTQTWKIALRAWSCDRIRLPLAPVQSIASVTYFDAANAAQTLDPANYALLEDALSPYVGWTASAVLPGLADRDDAVAVTFIAGYGDRVSAVPRPIRRAARMLIGHWYENREAVVIGQAPASVPLGFDMLIAPLRRVGL